MDAFALRVDAYKPQHLGRLGRAPGEAVGYCARERGRQVGRLPELTPGGVEAAVPIVKAAPAEADVARWVYRLESQHSCRDAQLVDRTGQPGG